MKNLIMLTIMVVFLSSGCSLIPRLTFDSKGSTPQQTQKSKVKESCKGNATFNADGDMIGCTKGYKNFEQNYIKQERKYTFGEKIGNFFRKLTLWMIILVALGIFFPVLGLGTFIGRIFEGTFGIAKQALSGVARGVQRVRKRGDNIDIALDAELDEKYKKYIKQLKEKENIK